MITRTWLELEWDGSAFSRILVAETDANTLYGQNADELEREVDEASRLAADAGAAKVRVVPSIGYNA